MTQKKKGPMTVTFIQDTKEIKTIVTNETISIEVINDDGETYSKVIPLDKLNLYELCNN